MSVCATIIKHHGGDIKAENIKAGGAVFCLNYGEDKHIRLTLCVRMIRNTAKNTLLDGLGLNALANPKNDIINKMCDFDNFRFRSCGKDLKKCVQKHTAKINFCYVLYGS